MVWGPRATAETRGHCASGPRASPLVAPSPRPSRGACLASQLPLCPARPGVHARSPSFCRGICTQPCCHQVSPGITRHWFLATRVAPFTAGPWLHLLALPSTWSWPIGGQHWGKEGTACSRTWALPADVSQLPWCRLSRPKPTESFTAGTQRPGSPLLPRPCCGQFLSPRYSLEPGVSCPEPSPSAHPSPGRA